jgi:hypothetical protein
MLKDHRVSDFISFDANYDVAAQIDGVSIFNSYVVPALTPCFVS